MAETLEQFLGTVLWVSHDRGEVFRNCRRVCVLDQGKSQGTFTLRELFHEPVTEAAARLSGCKNYAEAEDAAREMVAMGVTALELCAGFGNEGIARIPTAAGPDVAVGAVKFDFHPALGFKSGDGIF